MPISSQGKAKVAPHVFAREFDEELVLLDLGRGEYFGLDELGARLWNGISEGRCPREVAKEVAGDYDVDFARLEADLTDLANELLMRGLLEEHL